jgi:tetratricopeptide (TPR) repeat protein
MRRGRGTRDAARATRARSGRPCEPVPMDAERTPDPEESAYDLLQRGQALQRADRLEPGKASILEALGRAYFNSGQHEEARDAFERLLDIDPSAHYAHYAVGQALKRLGDPTAAGTHLRLAVALSPETALYRQALARLGPDATPPGRTPG